jgi:hypothetical protein
LRNKKWREFTRVGAYGRAPLLDEAKRPERALKAHNYKCAVLASAVGVW